MNDFRVKTLLLTMAMCLFENLPPPLRQFPIAAKCEEENVPQSLREISSDNGSNCCFFFQP